MNIEGGWIFRLDRGSLCYLDSFADTWVECIYRKLQFGFLVHPPRNSDRAAQQRAQVTHLPHYHLLGSLSSAALEREREDSHRNRPYVSARYKYRGQKSRENPPKRAAAGSAEPASQQHLFVYSAWRFSRQSLPCRRSDRSSTENFNLKYKYQYSTSASKPCLTINLIAHIELSYQPVKCTFSANIPLLWITG